MQEDKEGKEEASCIPSTRSQLGERAALGSLEKKQLARGNGKRPGPGPDQPTSKFVLCLQTVSVSIMSTSELEKQQPFLGPRAQQTTLQSTVSRAKPTTLYIIKSCSLLPHADNATLLLLCYQGHLRSSPARFQIPNTVLSTELEYCFKLYLNFHELR